MAEISERQLVGLRSARNALGDLSHLMGTPFNPRNTADTASFTWQFEGVAYNVTVTVQNPDE
jgi:hypothetical protein